MRNFAAEFSEFVRRFTMQWNMERESGDFIDANLKRIVRRALRRITDFAVRAPDVLGSCAEVADLLREALSTLMVLERRAFPGTSVAQEEQVWKPGDRVIADLERVSAIIKSQLDTDKGDSPVAGAPDEQGPGDDIFISDGRDASSLASDWP